MTNWDLRSKYSLDDKDAEAAFIEAQRIARVRLMNREIRAVSIYIDASGMGTIEIGVNADPTDASL